MPTPVRVHWRDKTEDDWQEYSAYFDEVPRPGECVGRSMRFYKVIRVFHQQIEKGANYSCHVQMERM